MYAHHRTEYTEPVLTAQILVSPLKKLLIKLTTVFSAILKAKTPARKDCQAKGKDVP
jgi:hypothetical protein